METIFFFPKSSTHNSTSKFFWANELDPNYPVSRTIEFFLASLSFLGLFLSKTFLYLFIIKISNNTNNFYNQDDEEHCSQICLVLLIEVNSFEPIVLEPLCSIWVKEHKEGNCTECIGEGQGQNYDDGSKNNECLLTIYHFNL